MACLDANWWSAGRSTLFLAAAILGAATASATEPGDLPQQVRQAAGQFRPLAADDVELQRQALTAAVDRLEARLKTQPERGEVWQRYLQLEQLREALLAKEPSPTTLAGVYRRFTSGYEGLWLTEFADVRNELRRYLQALTSFAAEDVKADFQAKLEKLAERLDSYAKAPTPEEAWEIALTLRLLDEIGQVPDVVRTVHDRYDNANLLVTASRAMVSRGIEGKIVDEATPVRECILGSTIIGDGITNGEKLVELVPHGDRAVIDTVFRGVTSTKTTAYNRSVRVYSTGATKLEATKQICITADGVSEAPATADATTATQFNGLSAPCRLVERVAWKRAYKQKSQSESIAAGRAEGRLRDRIEGEGRDRIEELKTNFQTKFRQPLIDHSIFPEQLDFSTTAEDLRVVALMAESYQLAAGREPPPLVPGDLVIRLHESMITNTTDFLLSGMTVREDSLRSVASNYLKRPADEIEKDANENVAITMPAAKAPVLVSFADDTISIVIRAERIYKNDELILRRLPMLDIKAQYKLVKSADGVSLVRQGDVEVLPTGYKQEDGKPLPADVTIARNELKDQIDAAFPAERSLTIDVAQKRGGGRLTPVVAQARDGWLLISWKLGETPAPATVAAK